MKSCVFQNISHFILPAILLMRSLVECNGSPYRAPRATSESARRESTAQIEVQLDRLQQASSVGER